ncbi:MAG: Sapep family Mn(2+)-dependent dipeptidase [Oscillospiraceae bacterium]|nr:Sapep family Mn(2+)-dependent dipeptidase [Ruminococcus sp.]MCD8345567.1 Sapep family Mn(2+)-dependent dipeptidase [Oscillospiraceae bacterium]
MTQNETKEKLFAYIDTLEGEMISTLSELISFPSYQQEAEEGAPFGAPVRECLDHALAVCESFGMKTRNFDGYAGTVTFTEGEPELEILAHLDVVPEGTGWTSDPYTARISDGKLYGRGAIDDKGPAVSVIYAMKALKDLNIPLKKGVRLILGTNEENGSGCMRYYFSKEKPTKYSFTPDGCYPVINIEKGMIRGAFECEIPVGEGRTLVEFHGGKIVNAVPELASAVVKEVSADEISKAVTELNSEVWFALSENGDSITIEAHGVSAHASTPEMGKNSVTALLELLNKLSLDGEIGEKIEALCELFPYGETNGHSVGIDFKDEQSGELTCLLSILDYENGNLKGCNDIRLPVSFTVNDILNVYKPKLESKGFSTHRSMGMEPHYVPSDSPFVKTLLGVYEEVIGEKGECIAIGGGTYVHDIEGGVAFGAEFMGEDNHMHSADESIKLSQLVLNAKMFALAILRVCGE